MDKAKKLPENLYDIIIIGGGAAGFTAGLYAARGGMKVRLIESLSIMGQAAMTDMIENYPGVETSNGYDLISTFKKQAEHFGLECGTGTVKSVSAIEDHGIKAWRVEDENGAHEALSVIVASGASARKLGVPGEEEFLGKGVSYCATCDAAFFREKDIVVVGGGNTAVEEALFLTKFGKKVTVVHRRDRLRAIDLVKERAAANDKMEFVWDSVVEEVCGDALVEKVKVRNLKTDKVSDILCDGVFVFVGWIPNTGFIKDVVEMDDNGAVIIDLDMKTSAEGIFAGGDCCRKLLKQVVTACGDGATAAFAAQQYVDELKGIAYK